MYWSCHWGWPQPIGCDGSDTLPVPDTGPGGASQSPRPHRASPLDMEQHLEDRGPELVASSGCGTLDLLASFIFWLNAAARVTEGGSDRTTSHPHNREKEDIPLLSEAIKFCGQLISPSKMIQGRAQTFRAVEEEAHLCVTRGVRGKLVHASQVQLTLKPLNSNIRPICQRHCKLHGTCNRGY